MLRLPAILVSVLVFASAVADDQVRDVQGVLKAKGFYYGEITGAASPEMDSALRRFQIRNGITVTGKLNAETLATLGLGAKKTVVAAPPNPPPANQQVNPAGAPPNVTGKPVVPEKNSAVTEIESTPVSPTRRALTRDPSVIDPPAPLPAPVANSFSTMFRNSPYAGAPREVQVDILRRAQSFLAARRLYRGPIDGLANVDTSEAIFLFQSDADLRRTGRLDAETLAEMNLLPAPAPGAPLLKPFFNPNRRRDRSVLPE